MACYSPVSAFRLENGDVTMVERGDVRATLSLPCGRCVGCRLERARQWTVRVMHEASLHERNCFLTLTYREDAMPSGGSLNYADVQRFLKRLRASWWRAWDAGGRLGPSPRVRYFVCGEYGERLERPHYHMALFGEDFSSDRRLWRAGSSAKSPLYRSASLEALWPHGFSSIGELTDKSAGYIARYVLKKVTGDRADWHYRRVDAVTGEEVWLVPEFVRMSLRPGVGAEWFQRFGFSDVFPHDRVVRGGVVGKPPRYYDKLARRAEFVATGDRCAHDTVKDLRDVAAQLRKADSTPERLKVKETVAKARLRFFKREL